MKRSRYACAALTSFVASVLILPLAPTLAMATAEGAPTVVPASVGECFNYTHDDMDDVWVMETTAVPCTDPHTAMTLSLTPSKVLTSMPPAGKLTTQQQKAMPNLFNDARTCAKAVARQVGTENSYYSNNMLYQPGPSGEVMLRCDLTLYRFGATELVPLAADPTDGYLHPICGKLAKGEIAYVRCDKAKHGILYRSGLLNPTLKSKWPGQARASALARKHCYVRGFYHSPGKESWGQGGRYSCYARSDADIPRY